MKKLFFVAIATLFLAFSCDQKNGTVEPAGGTGDTGCGSITTEYATITTDLAATQTAYLGDKSIANCNAFKTSSAAAAALFTNKRDCLITYFVDTDITGTMTAATAPGFVDGFAKTYQAQSDSLTCN